MYFIVGAEFCERFSFYGLKTVLFLYLTDYMQLQESQATVMMHSFVMLAYFFPLVGGVLGDSYWGKFRTIAMFSLVYCAANVLIAVTSVPGITGQPPQMWGIVSGLILLAIGTGGIKSNVSSFGGD